MRPSKVDALQQWIARLPWQALLPLLTFLLALTLMLVTGDSMIQWLRGRRWRDEGESWEVREDTPDTHLRKQGTPSMGGLGILASALIGYATIGLASFLYLFAVDRRAFFMMLGLYPWGEIVFSAALAPTIVAGYALLGWMDDRSKATGHGGLRARTKFIVQIGLSLIFLTGFFAFVVRQSYLGIRFVPSYWVSRPPTLVLGGALALVIIVVGTCNAVNLTDGIDGLAAGLAVQVGLAFWLCSNSNMYDIGYLSDLLWLALAGACLAFLNFNRHPARVFMGDTGSLALGGALGVGAVLAHRVFLLPFVAFIYYAEMFSVMAQVGWFKWTRRRTGMGQRILRRAPLHHHFELGGWSEWRVVGYFWLANLITTVIGLSLWQANLLPRWP